MERYDWSRVVLIGTWAPEEVIAFLKRVAEIADEEAVRNAPPPRAS